MKKKFKKNLKKIQKKFKKFIYIIYYIYKYIYNMSNDIIIIKAVEINKEYMLHLHQEIWRLREILEKNKIVYEENVWADS